MSLANFDERQPLIVVGQIVPADTTTKKQLSGSLAGAGARLDNLLVTSTDVIDHKVDFWINVAGVDYLIGSVDVPAGQGKGGTPAVDAGPILYVAGAQGQVINTSLTFSFSCEVTVTAGAVQCVGVGGYF